MKTVAWVKYHVAFVDPDVLVQLEVDEKGKE